MNKLLANQRFQRIVILVLPLLLYANTLPNKYALDDFIVITQNEFVQQGLKGIPKILDNDSFTGFFKKKKKLVEGGRYRPLSLITFAVEHQLTGNDPFLSHLINALLYSLICFILYKLLIEIQESFQQKKYPLQVAFFSTLLFAIHPIHTEVVANIKGRDELLALLFSMLALMSYFVYLKKKNTRQLFLCGIYIFLGLLSKEDTITMIFIAFFVSIVTLIHTPSQKGKAVIRHFAILSAMGIAVIIYWRIRYHVIGAFDTKPPLELMDNPFLFAKDSQKYATIFYTMLLYIKLLIVPYPLTYDYYPYHIALQQWNNGWSVFSVIIYVTLLVSLIFLAKRHRFLFFNVLFYLIPLLLVSNLFINIGTFMNERFVFFSSVGFCTAVVYLFLRLRNEVFKSSLAKHVPFALFMIVFVTYGGITLSRNTDWKNNYTLFLHDVKISANSAKGNCMAGGVLLQKAEQEKNIPVKKQLLKRSIAHLERSVSIDPYYVDPLLLLGNAYYEYNADYKRSLECYRKILMLAPDYSLAIENLEKILQSCQNAITRIKGYSMIVKIHPSDFTANYQLGITYGKMLHRMDTSLIYLKKAEKIQPDNKDLTRDLGVAYAMNGQFKASLPYFQRSYKQNPNNAANLINLGMTYKNLGNIEKAKEYFAKARILKDQKRKTPDDQ